MNEPERISPLNVLLMGFYKYDPALDGVVIRPSIPTFSNTFIPNITSLLRVYSD